MNTKKGFFLDTATQIARCWHTSEERNEIRQQIKDCKIYCSCYVKCQYKATVVESAKSLFNLYLRSQDLREAIHKATEWRYSKEAGGKLTLGVLTRIVDIACWIWGKRETREEQLGRLRDLVEWAWEEIFEEGLEPLIDETGCVYAQEELEMGESGAYKPIRACRKDNPPECGIQQFWNKHRIQLEALANMDIGLIEAEPKDTDELEKVKEHAREIISGESPHGQRCRVHLSDAIICVESTHCPETVAVHSINKKHFRPLGEVLGVECEPKD